MIFTLIYGDVRLFEHNLVYTGKRDIRDYFRVILPEWNDIEIGNYSRIVMDIRKTRRGFIIKIQEMISLKYYEISVINVF